MITVIRTQAFVKMVRKYNHIFSVNAHNAFSIDEDLIGKRPYTERMQAMPLTEFQALHLFKSKRTMLKKNNFIIAREIVDYALTKMYVETYKMHGSDEEFLRVTFEGSVITDKPFGLILCINKEYGAAISILTGTVSVALITYVLNELRLVLVWLSHHL